jgi:hypothetical protein
LKLDESEYIDIRENSKTVRPSLSLKQTSDRITIFTDLGNTIKPNSTLDVSVRMVSNLGFCHVTTEVLDDKTNHLNDFKETMTNPDENNRLLP